MKLSAIQTIAEHCEFCQELRGKSYWLRPQLLSHNIKSRLLLKQNGIVTLAGLGPLSPGYALILPEKHFYSLAEMPINLLEEIERQKTSVYKVFEEIWGGAVSFEHGATQCNGNAGACIDHAHLHIVAGSYDFRSKVKKQYPEHKISGIFQLSSFHGQPYIFVENMKQEGYVYDIPSSIPSQFMRRIWAQLVDSPDEWDWACFPNYDLMIQTVKLPISEHYLQMQVAVGGGSDE